MPSVFMPFRFWPEWAEPGWSGGLVWMFYGRNHSSRLSTPTGGHTGTVPPASLRPAAVTALLSA